MVGETFQGNGPASPVEWLEQEFMRRRQARSQYSLRQFARKLDLPPGRLSEFLSRKRRITPLIAERVATRLDYSPHQRDAFLKSVHLSAYAPRQEAPAPSTELAQEVFQLIADWYHFAILSLIETVGWDPRPSRIAKRLGISVVEARHALDRLQRLGLIEKRNNTWVRTKEKLSTTWDIPSAALRTSHKQELERAILCLDSVAVEKRNISAYTMAINPKKLPEAKKLIRQFQYAIGKVLETNPKTEVYTLNIQLLPVTKENT